MNVSRFALVLALALDAACSSTKPAPKPEPPPVTRTGTVGLVAEVKERGVDERNILGVISSIWTHDTDQTVLDVRWEVTMFYDDGTQGVVYLPEKPALQPGQRVRVTGNKIEPVKR